MDLERRIGSVTAALLSMVLGAVAPGVAFADELPADPLKSVMWEDMAKRFLADGAIVFDARVRVMIPRSAEDQFAVPVTVDASALANVSEIVVLADLNPIPRVLAYHPVATEPFIAFKMKVEQTTPVRAAVRTKDGTWHVGGNIVDAAGGGCSAPAAAYANPDWAATLGETKALAIRAGEGQARVSVGMRHPMDTGLVDGIPAFHLARIAITGADGSPVAELDVFEPVSEDPVFTLQMRVGPDETALDFLARDTEGNVFRYRVAVPAASAGR